MLRHIFSHSGGVEPASRHAQAFGEGIRVIEDVVGYGYGGFHTVIIPLYDRQSKLANPRMKLSNAVGVIDLCEW